MRIFIINPPHQAIGSRMAKEHLPPLGLLSIAGPLIDAGYQVSLLDADYSNMPLNKIIARAKEESPDFILMGHSGSTSAQPIINELAIVLKEALSNVHIIIGGVFPTFHWKEIMQKNPAIDYIVCGEGEQVMLELMNGLKRNNELLQLSGIVLREKGEIIKTPPAKVIDNLDDYRIAWELMEGYNYTYWGKKKAVAIQFSRGCSYPCSYCGQSVFWQKFRHRDPQKFADELEMLHRKYGVEVINFADENPSTDSKAWREFLQILVDKNLNLILVGSIRADNIVRDENHLSLYKRAGFERFLLGIEGYSEEILKKIKKAGSKLKDKKAIDLLRKHNIISLATYVVGFGEEKMKDFFASLKQLLAYDPDQIQLIYATPHKWTSYFNEVKDKRIVQTNQSRWDYKHQVLEIPKLKPWKVILLVKCIEIIMQARPKAIARWLFHKDKAIRKAMFWYNNIGKRVWFHELFQFFFIDKRTKAPVLVKNYWS